MNKSEDTSSVSVVLHTARAGLIAGRETTLTVLVRLQAPDAPSGSAVRQALHLALVLDRSGSMSGEPLEEAKRCARYMVENLRDSDRASVTVFDDEIESMAPLAPVGDRVALKAALTSIESGGSTNLHGGWHGGASELADQLAADGVHRVILLSDGCANQGETDLEVIAGQCRDLARRGVTTSTYGLGRDFNENLMLAMAKAGRGNAYYGQTAADLAQPFQAEFALLTNLCARGLVLKVLAPAAIKVSMRNDYDPVEGQQCAWKLPDVAFGSEAWAILQLTLPAELVAGSAPLQLPVTFAAEAAEVGSSPMFMMSGLPPLPLLSETEWRSLPADDLVSRRSSEIDAADALEEMRSAIAQSDWRQAEALLEAAEKRFAGHEWTQSILAAMRRLIERRELRFAAKEALYASETLNSHVRSRSESASLADEDDLPAFLRRKPEQGKGVPR